MKTGRTTIESVLAAYIKNECLSKESKEKLSYDKNLFESGIIDSAGLITYICFIEEEFNIKIPDEDLLPENFSTVNTIAGYIRTQQKVINQISLVEN